MKRLIALLNTLQGIRTCGCCGGHSNPTSIQQPEGKWFLSFWAYSDGKSSKNFIRRFCRNNNIKMHQSRKTGYVFLNAVGDPREVAKKLQIVLMRLPLKRVSS
jgi:hypothetical protein